MTVPEGMCTPLATHSPIRNKHLAGRTHPKTNVPYSAHSYPMFDRVYVNGKPIVRATVEITLTGDRWRDNVQANDKFMEQYPELRTTFRISRGGTIYDADGIVYTWHHVEDGNTMQLVPFEIHHDTGHTGGYSLKGNARKQ